MRKVFYFRHTPIDVDRIMYEKFSSKICNGLTVIADTDFSSERIKCGYSSISEYYSTVILREIDNKNKFLDELFENNMDSIYIFNGIGFGRRYIDYIRKYNIKYYGFIAERDCSVEDNLKEKIKRIFPRLSYLKYRRMLNNCSFFLAMGRSGIECYKKFGVKTNLLFNFMYNDGNEYHSPIYSNNECARFIYIGRFYNAIKGTDTLLDALKQIQGPYTFDFVGGYGPDREMIFDEIQKNKYCRFLGTWDSDDVCNKLNEYDVIVVPSKRDGWNLHNNLSIMAGIGCISSNETGSEELIEKCGNGIVFQAGNINELRKAIEYVIYNKDVVDSWKKRTEEFYSKISPEAVSDYFIEVLKYAIGEIDVRPLEPWSK